jgi:hypothetical protein
MPTNQKLRGGDSRFDCYLFRKANQSMFDDLTSLEGQAEVAQKSEEEEDKPARSLSRWSHVIAGLVFCLMYFPFQDHPWSWLAAIAASYSAFAFAIALGLALDDADDFFGDSRVLSCCNAAPAARSNFGGGHVGSLSLAPRHADAATMVRAPRSKALPVGPLRHPALVVRRHKRRHIDGRQHQAPP